MADAHRALHCRCMLQKNLVLFACNCSKKIKLQNESAGSSILCFSVSWSEGWSCITGFPSKYSCCLPCVQGPQQWYSANNFILSETSLIGTASSACRIKLLHHVWLGTWASKSPELHWASLLLAFGKCSFELARAGVWPLQHGLEGTHLGWVSSGLARFSHSSGGRDGFFLAQAMAYCGQA